MDLIFCNVVYRMWTTTGEYSDPGMDYYEQKYQERIIKNLQKKAQTLGLDLVPITQETQNTSPPQKPAT